MPPPFGKICGADKLSGDAAEYPCLRRFRHRRLISMLWLQGFEAAAESMFDESDAMFSMLRLRQLIVDDQWRDALRYLSRFLPTRPPLSVEAMVLRLFLGAHQIVADNLVGGGGDKGSAVYGQYLRHDRTVCPGLVRLRCILFNVLYCRHQLRVSIDWESVRHKAAEIARALARRTPELQDVAFMPSGPLKPRNVLPIGFGFRRRYPLKKRPAARLPNRASALANHYLGIRRSLPATSGPSQELSDELLIESKALDWVAHILDECLKAGKRPESHQVFPLQTGGMNGATVAPVSQTVFSGLPCSSTTPGMPSMGNEGRKSPSHVPTNGTPFLGTMHAPVPQTAIGCLTSRFGNSCAGLMASADKFRSHLPTPGAPFLGTMGAPVSQTAFGAPAAPGSQMMNVTSHSGDSGVVVAPISLNMIGSTLTDPAETSGMPTISDKYR